MGSSSSKPAKQVGKVAAGARPSAGISQPNTNMHPTQSGSRSSSAPEISPHDTSRFTKDQSILQDARDPQFLKNLQALGESPIMMDILRARAQHEGQELAPGTPGLSAPDLVRLLEEYRMFKTEKTLDRLAVGYDVDRDQLARLVRFVDVPDEQPMPTN